MEELTKRQVERQDYVDNKIHALIQDLIDSCSPPAASLDWDIELIGSVRDVIEQHAKRFGIHAMRFYPYLRD